ncbi:hypothetical protein [Bradyrhizobium sp. AS23.2]|uniref:hypothetical protein n=1 Tax=Bradyrhizobium sp. AS23.2 TaxID=1680155 RepID=UPI000938CC8A|nr:hypothetical protein [Bradyrhizobium sp. AS23.2]OKO85054.1 hypothetical protein AC630_06665 [Bradyrhizobium sp. AS23.2]
MWWDESSGLSRITAIADSRAAFEKKKHEWVPFTELTVKLFAIPLRCRELEKSRDTQRGGVWTNPYHVTQIGIAFAGYCFEALTIIALVEKCMGSLATMGSATLPEPEMTANFVEAMADRHPKTHTRTDTQSFQFLIFGFWPETKSPWLAELSYWKGDQDEKGISRLLRR